MLQICWLNDGLEKEVRASRFGNGRVAVYQGVLGHFEAPSIVYKSSHFEDLSHISKAADGRAVYGRKRSTRSHQPLSASPPSESRRG